MLASQLKEFVIEPVLDYLELNSKSAINLLLGTVAAESDMAEYLRQINFDFQNDKGAFGPWGIEIPTDKDVIRYLERPSYKAIKSQGKIKYQEDKSRSAKKHVLFLKVMGLKYGDFTVLEASDWNLLESKVNLIGNLYYQCAIARCKYLMSPEPLPAHDDVEGMAKYWKKWYNSEDGKGTAQGFIEKYNKYVLCGT